MAIETSALLNGTIPKERFGKMPQELITFVGIYDIFAKKTSVRSSWFIPDYLEDEEEYKTFSIVYKDMSVMHIEFNEKCAMAFLGISWQLYLLDNYLNEAVRSFLRILADLVGTNECVIYPSPGRYLFSTGVDNAFYEGADFNTTIELLKKESKDEGFADLQWL